MGALRVLSLLAFWFLLGLTLILCILAGMSRYGFREARHALRERRSP